MTTVLLAQAGLTVTLAALLLLVMVVQAALPARLRRDVGAPAGAAISGVEAATGAPQAVGSR